MSKIQCGVHRQWLLIGPLLLIIVSGIIGCAGYQRFPIKNSAVLGDQEGLRASYSQYWHYFAGKEVDKTFACEAPYVREILGRDAYRLYQNLFMKADLQEVEVLNVTCEQPFLCCVDCRLTYAADSKQKVRERRDCWVRVEGTWYHVLKNQMLFPQLGG
jgi:hypothetical protein